MRRETRGAIWSIGSALLAASLAISLPPAALAQGILQRIRDDVRADSSSSSSGSSSQDSDDDDDRRHGHRDSSWDDDDHDDFYGFIVFHSAQAAFYTVTSPFWAPCAVLEDEWPSDAYFPRFPYNDVPGYMMRDPCECWDADPTCAVDPLRSPMWPTRPRTWAARVRVEYADEFDDLERVSGHLLLSTRTRFGLDTETSYYQERLPGGGYDHLWLGDCNVTFRFAQGEHAQFRTGLGFNWLDDPIQTDFGFNFTYGADLFPFRPCVFSATIDWGTLGEAELFRFRTTAGVVFCGVEVYTGYEYLDIDAVQMSGLIGGVRIWF